jgi:hypothetical protein
MSGYPSDPSLGPLHPRLDEDKFVILYEIMVGQVVTGEGLRERMKVLLLISLLNPPGQHVSAVFVGSRICQAKKLMGSRIHHTP